MLPPIMYTSLSFWGKLGSTLTATARLVSGPRATRETCRKHILIQLQTTATHHKQSTQQFLTWFRFSDTSLIIASIACSLWIFSSHCGSLSLITSPSPSVPKWSVRGLLAPTRGPAQPRNTGICRRKTQPTKRRILISFVVFLFLYDIIISRVTDQKLLGGVAVPTPLLNCSVFTFS